MPINQEQEAVIAAANRRLAIFAKLSRGQKAGEPGPVRFRFAKDGRAADGATDGTVAGPYKLDAATFFSVVKPELIADYDPSDPTLQIKIGADTVLQGFKLLRPADAAEGDRSGSFELRLDSQLLQPDPLGDDAIGGEKKRIQRKGGRLFAELVRHVDTLARLEHPNFARMLTAVVVKVIPLLTENEAQRDKRARPDTVGLQKLLTFDASVRGPVLAYLLCLDEDEESVKRQIKSALVDATETPFLKDPQSRDKQHDDMLRALAQLKKVGLRDGLLTIGARNLRTFLEDELGKWVSDFSADSLVDQDGLPEYQYRFPLPPTGNRQDFFGAYGAYMEAASWVAQFLRTQVLHSYVFCWLVSKYHEHGEPTSETAQAFFDATIKNGKTQGITPKLVRELRTIGDEVYQEVINEVDGELRGGMEPHLMAERDAAKRRFTPNSAFTRPDAVSRTKELFVLGAQLAGGTTAELHSISDRVQELMFGLWQPLLKLAQRDESTDNDRLIELAEFRRQLVREWEISGPDVAELGRIQTPALDKAELVARLLPGEGSMSAAEIRKLFARNFFGTAFRGFAKAYEANKEGIDEEYRVLEHLFDLWRSEGAESKDKAPGNTLLVNLGTIAVSEKKRSGEKGRRRQADAIRRRQTQKVQPEIEGPVPAQVARRLGAPPTPTSEATTMPVRLGDRVLGSATYDGERITVTRNPDVELKPLDPSDINDIVLDIPTQGDGATSKVEEVSVVELELPIRELFPVQTEAARHADRFDDLAKTLALIHRHFSNKDDPFFRRKMRALALGKMILAAPTNQIKLGEKDLSNTIGIMMELIEQVGEPEKPLYGNRPHSGNDVSEQEIASLFAEVDLSGFYKLNYEGGEEELARIIQYHYDLCKSLDDVSDYLHELSELKKIFDAVRDTKLEVELVNQRFDEFATTFDNSELFWGQVDDRNPATRVDAPRPPLIAYLTQQAVPGAAGVAISEGGRRLLAPPLGELDKVLRNNLGNGGFNALQLPAIFLAPGVPAPDDARGFAFPVFSPDMSPLPRLPFGGADRKTAAPLQEIPFLLWAISVLASGTEPEFGRYLGSQGTIQKWTTDNSLPHWDIKTQSVYSWLRSTWTEDVGNNRLVLLADQMRLLKAMNYLIMEGGVPREFTGLVQHLGNPGSTLRNKMYQGLGITAPSRISVSGDVPGTPRLPAGARQTVMIDSRTVEAGWAYNKS